MSQCSVIMLSPDADFSASLAATLERPGMLAAAENFDAALELLSDREPQILVADLRLVTDGGHAADRFLETVQGRETPPTILLLTAGECPEPVERRAACSDIYHLRGVADAGVVGQSVQRALAAIEQTVRAAKTSPAPSTESTADAPQATRHFETHAPGLRRMLDELAIASAHDVTILLIGETGSGKTHLSRLIHDASPRRDEPFIHVACGALPRELIESELFGHVKGAFTSAHADKEGKFLAAGRGTILLDEIDVLGPEQQVKLLRVIETREFEAVGSNRTHRSQARLIVASNLELQPLVEQGRFRPDLYYRLNMLKFDLPPMRQRKADIVPLARKFVGKFSEQHAIPVQEVDETFFDALLQYPWPGNVRELEHVVQRAVIYCRDGRLTTAQLPSHIMLGEAGPVNDPSVRLPGRVGERDTSLESQVAHTEKDLIEEALLRNNFSRTNTAKDLGISRVTLYNKMKRYALMK